jgi:hypothetical protein
MKKHTYEARYKNGAVMRVTVQNAPKNWTRVEPRDVLRISLHNKQYGLKGEEWLMRPDEALTLISLLSEATHYAISPDEGGENYPIH